MGNRFYTVGYRPLAYTGQGREAIKRFGRPPFADYSCRSEPSLEHPYPAVTALCRGGAFAPRLRVGDMLSYVTNKTRPEYSYRLTAVVRVIHRLDDHATAAKWYRERDLELPANLIVPGNPALPVEQTAGVPADVRPRTAELWDAAYRARARRHPVVLITEPLYVELQDPPYVPEAAPLRENPPAIPAERFQELLWSAGLPFDVTGE